MLNAVDLTQSPSSRKWNAIEQMLISPLPDSDLWQVATRVRNGKQWMFDPAASLEKALDVRIKDLAHVESLSLVRQPLDIETFDPEIPSHRLTYVLCKEGGENRRLWVEFCLTPDRGPVRPATGSTFFDLKGKLRSMLPNMYAPTCPDPRRTAFDLPLLARADLWIRHDLALSDFFSTGVLEN
ncbi:hypothetical protein [Methylocella sp. CPCC 101449]|uniref:hypothetical protein n=1 Tax=Methylocella sp. CPCC 101449 TaxID=2987531 RepID=UPI00288F6A7E|nr:hypothetical protein [Methylocella sp. CPCC 101449]MDT2024551.1 hypothetical protein [Methylocella sp. CPCC 101449]